jgi:apolipoprotein N-acyltransferase
MLVDADQFAWAIPLACLGLPAVLACFTAAGFATAQLLWSAGPARLFALAACLGGAEWLRGLVATGFPWNELGMALGGNLALAQTASIVGLYGLNFVAIALFAAPALLRDPPLGRLRRPGVVVAAILAAFALLGGFGLARLSRGPVDTVAGVKIRLMQPNLKQDEFFSPENKDKILDRYLSLSDRATSPQTTGVADVTHLLWPESAFPFILARDAAALGRIQAALGPKTILITGAARMVPGPAGRNVFHNSIEAIDRTRGVFADYDKVHLVPFGEYLPFDDLLRRLGLRNLVHVPGGFTPGAQGRPMSIPGLPPVSALVCYEALFPGEVVPRGGERPGLLLNVSDDSWYGETAGPWQHFSQARLRAVEEGLPLVRVATNGVSAFVDPYGRVIASLPVGVADVLDGSLPKPIAATPFAQWPLAGPFGLLALCLAIALTGRLWRRRKP